MGAVARRALLAAAAVVAAAAVAALPWVSRERTVITATPVPAALQVRVPVALAPGERTCLDPVTVPRGTGAARFETMPASGASRLRLTAEGPGYTAAAGVASPAGAAALSATLPVPRDDVVAKLCIVNVGGRRVALAGTIEPRRGQTTLDGRPAELVLAGVNRFPLSLALTLTEPAPRSLAERPAQILGHMTAFRPALVTRATLALLLLALLALAAAGAPWAYARALAGDERARR